MQYGPGFEQGAENYISTLAKGLVDYGWEPIVFSGITSDEEKNYRRPLNIIKLPTTGWGTVTGKPVHYFQEKLAKIAPDILHLVHPGHIGTNIAQAAINLRIPLIITVVDYWWLCPKNTLIRPDGLTCEGNKPPSECRVCIMSTHRLASAQLLSRKSISFSKFLMKANDTFQKLKGNTTSSSWENRHKKLLNILKNADAIVTLSKTATEKLTRSYQGILPQYIPVGLSEIWFKKERSEKAIQNGAYTLGFAGAIAPHKGLHTLIDAIRDIQNVHLKIAGPIADSRYWQSLQPKLRSISHSFSGSIARAGMPSFIDGVDAMIVPSLSPENQPQVVLESQARNRLVIVSDMPGVRELQSNDALVFQAGNPDSLRSTLLRVLAQNKTYRQPTPITAREMVERTVAVYRNSLVSRSQQ